MAENDGEKKEAAPIESVKEKVPENFHDSSASDPVSGIKHSPAPPSDPVSGIKHSPAPPSDPVSGIKHSPAPPSDPVSEIKHSPAPASDPVSEIKHSPAPATVKVKSYHMFGREKPLHYVFGGGKFADVFLWRDKKLSCVVLGLATLVWILFEVLDYHFITFVCHVLILALSVFFLWSNVSSFINKSPLRFPEFFVPEDVVLGVASSLRFEINRSFAILRDIVSGKQLKKFLAVIAGLWFASVVGGWFNFLTLLYISFVLLLTVPVLYEKYENQVDPMVEKTLAEFEKQYAAFDDKVLSQIPIGPSKEKKTA